MQNKTNIPEWVLLNNQIIDESGQINDLNKDKEAVRSYFFKLKKQKYSTKEKLFLLKRILFLKNF